MGRHVGSGPKATVPTIPRERPPSGAKQIGWAEKTTFGALFRRNFKLTRYLKHCPLTRNRPATRSRSRTAGHRQGLAGDPGRVVGGEEHHRMGDVLRLAEAT